MSGNEKKWIYFEGSKFLVNSISGVFIALFLWQAKQDLSLVLQYFLALYIGIPIFGTIASYLAEVYNAKLSFLISYLAKSFLLISLLNYSGMFIENPFFYGIIYAIDIGFFAIPKNAVFQSVISPERISKVTALLGSLSTIVNILVPVIGAYLITFFGSYNPIFAFALISLVFSAMFLLFLKIQAGDGVWQIKDVFSVKHSEDFRGLVTSHFTKGIKDGLEWALFGVITLAIVGNNLPSFGNIKFIIELVSVLAGFVYIKLIANKADVQTLLITGLMYAAATVIFVSNFNFTSLIFFLTINTLANSFIGAASSSVTSSMISEDKKAITLLNEYYAFIEYPLALGRIIPIAVLILAGTSLTDDFSLKIIFLVIGTVPIFVTEILKKTRLVRNQLPGLKV